MLTPTRFAYAAALCVLVGCGGATTPTEASAGGDAGTNVDATLRTPAAGRLTEACDGVEGLTAQSVLDKLDVPVGGTFSRWAASGPPTMESPSPLLLQVHYDGGDVHCTVTVRAWT